jgi:hypothetical protein
VLLVRTLDLVLLAVSLPVFLAADLPMAGWGAGAGAWLAQRAIQWLTTRRAAASDQPRTVVGLLAASMIGRGWLVAGIIFAVGANDDAAGLAAAVLVIALFTTYFTIGMILHAFDRAERRAARPVAGAGGPAGRRASAAGPPLDGGTAR